jgi:CRISPR/Cas system-associated exonuclease Cas4 (RecB family)
MIKELVLEQLKSREGKGTRREFIRASEIGSCPLAVALRLKGIRPDIPEDKLMVLEIGSKLHLTFQEILKNHLTNIEKELVDEELKLSGHIDGTMEVNGELYIVEFKTISPYALRYGNVPYEHHIDQLHAYMYLWNKTQDTRIEKGLLVYMDKSSGNIYEYEIPYEMRMDFLLDRISEIRSLTAKSLCEIDFQPDTSKCKWCFYRLGCPSYGKLVEEVS